MSINGYELIFPAEAELPDRVEVRRTGATGPGGHPVYSDATGIIRAEISESGDIRMLPTGTHQSPRRPSSLRRLESPQ
ncbi:DUF6296 family protein [Streptacidiphilus sp. EB129]|uniref:DUF6296 family protein n=1 Tax=Streptacidiphilus sp. EB129 TaxID=3156262 RepID=UPI0035170244